MKRIVSGAFVALIIVGCSAGKNADAATDWYSAAVENAAAQIDLQIQVPLLP